MTSETAAMTSNTKAERNLNMFCVCLYVSVKKKKMSKNESLATSIYTF